MAKDGHNMEASVKYKLETDSLESASSGFQKTNEQVKELTQSLSKLESAMKNVGKSNSIESSSKSNQSYLMQQKQMYQAGLQSHEKYVNEIYKQEEDLRKKLASMKTTDKDFSKTLNEYRAYQTEVERIEKANSSIVQREAKAQASYRQKEIAQSVSEYRKLNTQIQQMANTASTGSMGNSIFNGMLTYGAINQVTSALQEVSSAIVDINYNTVNNQRLMGNWSTELRDQLNEAATSMAKSTGIQITDAQQIQGAWIRINDEYAKSPTLLNNISQLTAEFMNVGEITNADKAVNLLNASILQLGDNTKDSAAQAKEFLDKWSYMADITATGTPDEYGEGIAQFGAQLKNMNGDMDDAISLVSVLSDRLAMTGSEAGNALKTFTAYMNRDKTRALFKDIADDLGDTSYKLADDNGKLKDFRDNLDTIAKAYQHYKQVGNDVMVNDILGAVGATRRRDVAAAILNSVNDGSFDNYLNEVKGDGSTDYIAKQNEALMETLKNQWNSLVASMTSAGMSLANSGILDSLTNIISVASGAFDAFSQLPEPVLKFISTLATLKVGLEGVKKIGDITGIGKEFSANMKQGSQESRQMAAAISNNVQMLEKQNQAVLTSNSGLYNTTAAYRDVQQATLEYNMAVQQVAEMYTSGQIDADQYTRSIQQLTTAYQQQLSSIQAASQETLKDAENNLTDAESAVKNATSQEEKANAIKKAQVATEELKSAQLNAKAAEDLCVQSTENIVQAEQKEAATKESTLGKIKQKIKNLKEETNTKKQNASATNQVVNNEKKEAESKQQTVNASKKSTTAQKQEKVAKQQNGSQSAITAAQEEVLSAATSSVGRSAGIASAALGTLKGVLSTLFSPATIILTVISAIGSAMANTSGEADKFQSELDETQSELEETQSRIQELNELKQSRGLTAGETSELLYLKEKNQELERSITLTKQAQANSEYNTHQGGFFGIGGKNSKHEDIQDTINQYKNLAASVKTYTKMSEDEAYTDNQRVAYKKMLSKSNEEYAQSAAQIISTYHDLKTAIDSGSYSGKALEQAKIDLEALEDLLPSAKLLVNSVDNTGYSFKTAAEQAQEYAQAVEDAANAASESSTKYNALESAIGSYEQNGYLTDDEVQSLVSKGSEFANLVEWTGDHWKLVDNYQEEANRLQQELNDKTREYVETQQQIQEQAERQAEAIRTTSDATSSTKNMVSDIQQAYGNVKGLKDFSNSVKQIHDDFAQGTYTIDDYNSKMKDLTENTDFSKILSSEQEISQMNEKQINQMYAQQEMWKSLYLDAGNTLTSLTDQYNNGQITQAEYAVGLAGVNDRFLQLAISSGIIKETENGFVDANGKTVEWANSLSQVSQSIGAMGALFSDNITSINQLMNGSEQEAQAACNNLSTQFTSTMDTLKSTNQEAWDAVVLAMYNASGQVNNMSFDEFKQKLNTDGITSDLTNNVTVMKAAFQELTNQMGTNIQDAASKGSDAMGTLQKDIVDKMGTAANQAKKKISSIQDAIDSLKGKTVEVTVNYKETNKPATVNGTGSGSTQTVYWGKNKSGKIFYSQANGNAFAEGQMGATYSGETLVGELGPEIVVRNNRWFTVGDFGAEFFPIRRGDIVFNHRQSQELLRNKKVTSGSGRGNSYANGNAYLEGNAFASGSKYSSSYKITDDLDVAMTKAVQKFSKEAERLIAQAVAAGENISDELREAAQNAEKIAKDVESYTSKYISNVESLQKRSADALKDHYKQEADERKKLLEKDHNAKLEAIDEEIAKLKGETTEDKEKQLADLQSQLGKWKNDNSSLGKKKQKELQEQIDDLDKEIKIDKLEKQRDNENDRYNNSIDSESDSYDSILKELDNKMTDENLYKTVNDLIRKNDTDTLSKLLTEHDSKWDGWKTLQGQTAGQVIQGEVKDAINNYKDVVGGYIDENGGVYTRGGNPLAQPAAPASSGNIGVGTTINAGSAPIYAYAGSQTGLGQYFANDPIYTVVGEQGGYILVRWHGKSDGYTGWFKKSDVKAYAQGGLANYTGLAQLDGTKTKPERILNPRQTQAFENLVYDFLPRISTELMSTGSTVTNSNVNNNNTTFNKELVKVEVGQIVNNTPYDVKNSEDNLDRMFRTSLKKSGVNFKVK